MPPTDGSPGSTVAELLSQHRLHPLGVRAAGGLLHDLAHEEPHEPGLSPAVAAHFIRMNDLVVQNVVVIPVLVRHATFAVANSVRGFDFSPFSGPLWRLAYWSRES